MPTNPSRRCQLSGTRAGVHSDWLANDEAIGDEFADGLAGIGVGDFVDFVRVEPDFALAAVGYGRRQALLRAEVHPGKRFVLVFGVFMMFFRLWAGWMMGWWNSDELR